MSKHDPYYYIDTQQSNQILENTCRDVQKYNFDTLNIFLISLTTLNSEIGAGLLNIDGTNIEGRKYEIVDM